MNLPTTRASWSSLRVAEIHQIIHYYQDRGAEQGVGGHQKGCEDGYSGREFSKNEIFEKMMGNPKTTLYSDRGF